MQTMSRVDRRLNPAPTFKNIHLSFDTVIGLFVRIKKVECLDERETQLVALYECLEMLVIPGKCYHSAIEHKFEVVYDNEK